MSIPFQRCDVCGRATTTRDGIARALEVSWDVERQQWLCMTDYQAAAQPSRPSRADALANRRRQGKTL